MSLEIRSKFKNRRQSEVRSLSVMIPDIRIRLGVLFFKKEQDFYIDFVDWKDQISNAGVKKNLDKTQYRGSPPYAYFGTWKKPCYMKLVLVGLYCGPLLTLISSLTAKNCGSGNRVSGFHVSGGTPCIRCP